MSAKQLSARKSERGAALVEASFILPPAIFLVLVLSDLCSLMHSNQVLTQIINDTLVYAASLKEWKQTTSETAARAMVRNHARMLVLADNRINLAQALSDADIVVTAVRASANYAKASDYTPIYISGGMLAAIGPAGPPPPEPPVVTITVTIRAKTKVLFPGLWGHDGARVSGSTRFRY